MQRKHTSEQITNYILENITAHPKDINSFTANNFEITRQSVNRHLTSMVNKGLLKQTGKTRNKKYELKILQTEIKVYNLPSVNEDAVWQDFFQPLVVDLKTNIVAILNYGITEMVNNVIDHSASKVIAVSFIQNPLNIEVSVRDKGIGIFKKIAKELKLDDESYAVLELSKGKVTTDKEHHTGEGIFFTSRMFDDFTILSGKLGLIHSYSMNSEDNWLTESKDHVDGTYISMSINIKSNRTMQDVFNKFTNEYIIVKTHVPVALAKYGTENLVSRSSAHRILSRLEPFKEVLLDFTGVDFIGPAFTDEIFRVFKNNHPDIELVFINANEDVERMIESIRNKPG